ncbi:hypothetical protein A2368_04455 [Candidatus Collierbacteria bacterium RIFOXYB1_FULL_49_13]|uniref:Uncharacterized protein n=1 Tax=Candidatus Collierbacteria bacterium RIFOXYB1_FULL_49_13 TaxID=1817728 RepID=A0A1F5FJG9_9BACT|nr:MAG: hypothetical protein A2368_04455 [Candidatus Collierbacteria bacterium RIFOXYB1_FULL_49_13]
METFYKILGGLCLLGSFLGFFLLSSEPTQLDYLHIYMGLGFAFVCFVGAIAFKSDPPRD